MKKTQISSQFYLRTFSIPFLPAWCLLLPCSGIWGSCFHLSGHEGFTLIFHRRCNQSILFVLCQSPQSLLRQRNDPQEKSSFLPPWKQQPHSPPIRPLTKQPYSLFCCFFFPNTGCFTKMRGENLPQNREAKRHCPLLTQLSPYLHQHSLQHSSFASEPILP